jgi:hypothetical protein
VFLVKMLLEKGKTVVYLSRTVSNESWYYQFIPLADGEVEVHVFPEKLTPAQIPSLRDPDTYYLVDPGMTKDSCDPSEHDKAHVIINASPDERHWGESEFAKDRIGFLGGVFRFYPLWKCWEVLAAAPFIAPHHTEDMTLARFREFGGVPRHVFAKSTETAEKEQRAGIQLLTVEHVKGIVREDAFVLGEARQPKCSVMGYESLPPFSTPIPVVISHFVMELIAEKHMGMLWHLMVKEPVDPSVTEDSGGAKWPKLKESKGH